MKKVEPTYINHLPVTRNWIDALSTVARKAIAEHKRVVVIAIARKMARLLKFYIAVDSRLQFLLDHKTEISVITEHSIPLCMDSATPDSTEVIILDDLVVFGDTVETVYEYVYCFTGIRANIIAMAASRKFRSSLKKKNVVYPVLDDPNNPDILPDSLIQAYTVRNSWDIVSLGHSIDLEHTILRIQTDSSLTEEETAEKLKAALASEFPDSYVYIISHENPFTGRKVYSVSVVFNTGGREIINSDFSKLRFYISPGEVSVVCYAPNIWDIPVMADNALRFNTPGLVDIWLSLRDTLTSVTPSPDATYESDLEKKFITEEFRDRVEHSAVVMANYLVSFDSLCLKKDKLRKVFESVFVVKPVFEICDDDLTLIVGAEMAAHIVPQLRIAFTVATDEVKTYMRTTLPHEELVAPLVPQLERESYMEERILDIFLTANIYSALSLIFNRLSEKFGLVDKRREDRIKVGETFDSLFNTLSERYPRKDMMEYVHRWIDSRIDLGVVVPKYEYTMSPLGFKVWRRYFRAGEREDTMKGMARAAIMIGAHLFEGSYKVTESDFIEKVVPDLCQLDELTEGQLDMTVFSRGIFANVNKKFCTAEYGLWLYLHRIGAIDIPDIRNLSEGRIVRNGEGQPVFTSTDLYDSPE